MATTTKATEPKAAATPKAAPKDAPKAAKAAKTTDTGARLRTQYSATIAPELLKDLDLRNFHQAPKLEKVVVNIGLGKAKDDKK